MPANDDIFDAYVRHQINLLRMSKLEARKLFEILRASEDDVNGLVKETKGEWSKKRLAALRNEIQRLRTAAWHSYENGLGKLMGDTAAIELSASKAIYEGALPIEVLSSKAPAQAALPVELNFVAPNAAAVRTLTVGTPFGGLDKMHQLSDWVAAMDNADQNRVMGALQAGITNGETIPQIQDRIHRAMNVSHAQAESLARTGVNHASNVARGEFFKENAGVLSALRWLATLDGRTSPICRAYDGQMRPVTGGDWKTVPEPHLPGEISPPAHMRCRSLLIGILDNASVAEQLSRIDRATVTDTRTGKKRQLDFEAEARGLYNQDRSPDDPPWSKLDPERKASYRSEVRKRWAEKNIGFVPGDTTYDQWLRKQSPEFQNEVLGKPRAELYRADPSMTMETFIDREGNLLSLEQLDSISPGPTVLGTPKVEAKDIPGAVPENIRNGTVEEWNQYNYKRNEEILVQTYAESIEKFPDDLGARGKWERDEIARRMRPLIPPNENPARYKEWLDSLTEDEYQSFRVWAQEGLPKFLRDQQRGMTLDADYMNSLDRNAQELFKRIGKEHGDVNDYITKVNNDLLSALERGPNAEGYAVYRGDIWTDLEVGDIFEHGYTGQQANAAVSSASYYAPEAVGFGQMRARYYGGQPVVYKHVGDWKGVNIQNLVGDPGLSTEAEVLMLPGQKYVVREINDRGDFIEVILHAYNK